MKELSLRFFTVLLTLGCMTVRLPAQVVISEFMASNSQTLVDEFGNYSDWIEIYNPSSTSVNLLNWSLTDDITLPAKWRFPATNLAAKGFMVVFASDTNRAVAGLPLHTGFSLKASGEYLGLYRPDGTVATEFAPTFLQQNNDYSYGISQTTTTNSFLRTGAPVKTLVPANALLGSTWTSTTFNDAAWTSGTTGVGYETAVAGLAVKNFKANVTVSSVAMAEAVISNPPQQAGVVAENRDVINYFGTGSDGHYGNNSPFPGTTFANDVDDFVIEATATVTIPTAGNWTFGVNSDDGFSLRVSGTDILCDCLRGPGDTLGVVNFPAPGDYSLRLVMFERSGGSGVELFAGPGNLAAWDSVNFRLVGDVANGGLEVKAPVVAGGGGGYRSLIATDVQTAMKGINASAYLRLPFAITNAAGVTALSLRMKYDDGFVAYLNGQEIARRNAPAVTQWNSAATAVHPNYQALIFEDINASSFLAALREGNNVLAVQALNIGADDSDFLVVPELVEYRVTSAPTNHYFFPATPGAINDGGFLAFVGDTKFSVNRGFYEAPFSLSITTATASATIYYTTNGTPPSPTNGYVYSAPLPINGTRVVRAAAYRAGFEPSNVDTHSYIFVSDVIRQSPTGAPPPGWPASWGANVVDYGMDPDVVNNPTYSGTITNDLKSLPSFSIVMNVNDLFDPTSGIYANPGQDGINWERPTSVELVYPDGTKGFQIDAGIRIRGGFSRSTSNPKHALRLFFRQEYGDPKLKFPLFGDDGTDVFDGIDLRTFQNYSWSFQGDSRGIFLRDQFSRDTQLAMGHNAERGNFYHLYINGQYWGLYNTCERTEASYGETYYGGIKEDYDVIKVEAGPYTINATDGTMDAWTRLYNLCLGNMSDDALYQQIQGNNPDGTPNPAYENLLDVPNLIDYMLVILYGGNLDAPISNFLSNNSPNNWYGLRNRNGVSGGFKFFAHDSEHTLLNVNEDRTGPYPAGDTSVFKSNPQWIWQRLQANAEFRLLVADHVQRHLFNSGALTVSSATNRFRIRKEEIDRAVVGESARWGDAKRALPFTRADWLSAINSVLTGFFPQRTTVLLNQLRTDGLYPALAAPGFNQNGGNVPAGFSLVASAPSTIYFTTDGTDPRFSGGSVSPSARIYSAPLTLNESVQVKARTFDGITWSAVNEATFYILQSFTNLLVTEIMYNPAGGTNVDADDFEFLELKNVSSSVMELSGIHFTNGIRFTFPLGMFLSPGQFVVLVSSPSAFTNRYPGVSYHGVFTGKLANSGDQLSLVHASESLIFSFAYDDAAPWPPAADGLGFSVVPVNPNLNPDPNNAINWRASGAIGGSPGADDPGGNVGTIWINEVLTHTDPPQLDSVELYNPNPTNVNIGNWFLTDDRVTPRKYQIPAGTVISAGGFVVFDESQFYANPGSSNSFQLNSHGDEIYLYSADAAGNLTGFSDGFSYGAAQNGVSFGRYTISTGEAQYPAQRVNSLAGANAGPRVGPVVINEILYSPVAGSEEFIELKSITNAPVPLYNTNFPTNTWRLNGVGFSFPANVELPANGLILLVASDPNSFRTKYGVPTTVQIFGPYPGTLQNNGELLQLQRPDDPDVDTNGVFVPYIDVDVVRYDNRPPWPTNAAVQGSSLERLIASAYGNDPVNWRASPGASSPGLENDGNRSPRVNAGGDQNFQTTNFPTVLSLSGTVTDDGLPNPPGTVSVNWTVVSGPALVSFGNANQLNTTASFGAGGTYTLRLTANDGALQTADDLTVTLSRAASPVTLVASNSMWKYLDNGSNLGGSWTSFSFNDSAWLSGLAELGYGDGFEATTNSFGPDPNNKYITTYYRKTFPVADAAAITALTLKLVRDDGAVVYLNSNEVFRSNMPIGPIDFRTLASSVVGGVDEATFFNQGVDPGLLITGNNVLAVEIHQVSTNSSDISFNLELSGSAYSGNTPPIANAGLDQSAVLPFGVNLAGAAGDDGLPVVPGRVSVSWAAISGPGTVTFSASTSLVTRASFSTNGVYALRLTANDGILSSTDDVTVTVTGQNLAAWKASYFTTAELSNAAISGDGADPDGDTQTNLQEYIAGTNPRDGANYLKIDISSGSTIGRAVLGFTAVAGRPYDLQYRSEVALGSWMTLTNISAQSTNRLWQIPDAPAQNTRFYRLVIPQP